MILADGPHPSLGAHADTYGRLIGSWTGDIHNHMVAPARTGAIEVHFSWALAGRAVQDVWITPANGASCGLDWYGTTLRVFDPKSATWRAMWWDPVSQLRIDLEGQRIGDDIVQLGTRGGRPIRWSFSEIRPASFEWRAHILEPDGATWKLEVAMRFRRRD